MQEKVWKILNTVLRCNFYRNDMRPKYIPFKLWNSLRDIYTKQVEIPYYKKHMEQIKQDLNNNPKTSEFSKYIK